MVENNNHLKKLSPFDWTAIVLVIIGGINWGLVGLFRFDLVAAIFGGAEALLSRAIYTVVGIAAIYLVALSLKLVKIPEGANTISHRRT